jgi:predicted transcriptional regulator
MSATHKVQVNVGSLAEMGKRFSKAWNQAAAGEQVDETNVTFLDVQTMLDTLSPRRLDMLRHVRQHGASNVRELALALARDYKNVHQDVAVLEATGLLIRDGRKLSAPWDELQTNVSLLPPLSLQPTS